MADSYLEDLVSRHKIFYYNDRAESEEERDKRMIFFKIIYDSVIDYDYLTEDLVTGDNYERFGTGSIPWRNQTNSNKPELHLRRYTL